MRMDGCKECGKLRTLKDVEEEIRKRFETEDMHQPGGGLSDKTQREFFRSGYKVGFEYALKDAKQEAIKWFKHFDKHPSPMQLGSCRTLSDFANITKKDLK